jgi:bisphosphoglycerate-independent phosphoglycerate mutase (AlkP superfamily)
MDKTMTALLIMDGFGINPAHEATHLSAGTPHLDELMSASGYAARRQRHGRGAPEGQMGNSGSGI